MNIDQKEKQGENLSKDIKKQQETVTQKRFEIEQQKLSINNFQIDHNYKVE